MKTEQMNQYDGTILGAIQFVVLIALYSVGEVFLVPLFKIVSLIGAIFYATNQIQIFYKNMFKPFYARMRRKFKNQK